MGLVLSVLTQLYDYGKSFFFLTLVGQYTFVKPKFQFFLDSPSDEDFYNAFDDDFFFVTSAVYNRRGNLDRDILGTIRVAAEDLWVAKPLHPERRTQLRDLWREVSPGQRLLYYGIQGFIDGVSASRKLSTVAMKTTIMNLPREERVSLRGISEVSNFPPEMLTQVTERFVNDMLWLQEGASGRISGESCFVVIDSSRSP
ncbi:hypothetical protein ADUPG1_013804 [Aduncisulcus paluster]|uniref:Uncharacterized protein n=1 Tax=Aduncisulcus paluster TaxID=2918883 RepID=A0ABQ5K4R3_9EUKA|nr:hypothetical protein ADUPG1_013804 [Aduncisulcus paluster]